MDSYEDFPVEKNDDSNFDVNIDSIELKINILLTMVEKKFEENDNNIKRIESNMLKLEKTLLSLNEKLIAQNIRLSDSLVGKLKEPELENNSKPLFYTLINENKIKVFGPGTFDNKSKLKSNGEWDSNDKSWLLNINEDKLKEIFPNIIQKNNLKENYNFRE